MSQQVGTLIAQNCQFNLGYTDRLLKDVSAQQFARQARPGGQAVHANHPAFVLGHLSLYGPRIVEQLGGDAASVALDAAYVALFTRDAPCRDDSEGTIYPTMQQLTDTYYRGYRAAIEVLHRADDAKFLEENPATGPVKQAFPTKGALHAFLCGGHMMVHLGQISVWRRMMGMPPA